MDETTTRIKKINPRLAEAGWDIVPDSQILYEQRAYLIAPGMVNQVKRAKPKKADYILEYKGKKLAVIEAKRDELDVSFGVAQAKEYAEMLNIRFTYSCNGDKIWAIDMGVKSAKGQYVIPSTEGEVDRFPTPQELWAMTYPDENTWRDKFNLCAVNRGGGKSLRYYQEIAVTNVLTAIANGQNRILLTMATGTGKTYTAFQICWKLFKTKWNTKGDDRQPRILFISDRNILANQALNDFGEFNEDAMQRITPKLLHKQGNRVPTGRSLYFTIFQTMMSCPKENEEELGNAEGAEKESTMPFFMQYPQDFFDFIIIDECHRGGANDESEWRRLMDWFAPAYQLGMTATPQRKVNANTYKYFGDPVYTYSLKQGINDGYLVPYRVKKSMSNIDDYQYREGDQYEGDLDKKKTYTESDFYNGNIEIRDRDEYRVKELLENMNPDDKTIIFCATQKHAMIIRDLINKYKRRPESNYCERVTADDGESGEQTLRTFQNNDKLRPTILTTSYKLSTGVDARNVRNIVLLRPINNMVEFKQIIGRGTRLFAGKYFFTIYDFVGASSKFDDPEWDGEPVCDVCGNYPCTCGKTKKPSGGDDDDTVFEPPKPCPVCGHLPCTCPASEKKRRTVSVELSDFRKMTLYTDWQELFQFGDELISIEEFMKRLFGRIPDFFEGEDDLRTRWQHPDTRQQLLNLLENAGFVEDKLEMLKKILEMDDCDLLDVLQYIAYATTPIERIRRVELVREQYLKNLTEKQREFDDFILKCYCEHGFKELGMENLSKFIQIKYGSIVDAKMNLGMTPKEMREHYIELQKHLYDSEKAGDVHFHFHGNTHIDTFVDRN